MVSLPKLYEGVLVRLWLMAEFVRVSEAGVLVVVKEADTLGDTVSEDVGCVGLTDAVMMVWLIEPVVVTLVVAEGSDRLNVHVLV